MGAAFKTKVSFWDRTNLQEIKNLNKKNHFEPEKDHFVDFYDVEFLAFYSLPQRTQRFHKEGASRGPSSTRKTYM